VTPDKEDSDLADVLTAVGRVKPPTSDSLENAREVLWSAVVEEMISSGDARIGSAEHKADEQQQTGRKRRQDSKRQTEQRRDARPGA
jgi:hypothetical protein